MAMSDRLKSIGEMTGSLSDRERMELNEFTKKLVGMPTRSPDRTIDEPTSGVRTSRIMDLIRGMNIPTSDKPDAKTMSMPTRSPDGSLKAREVEVAGAYEDMAMKLYQEAVEQGYKGTFFDFLIDRMDEEFDPSSPMRVSKLPEGIMQLMNMLKNKRKT